MNPVTFPERHATPLAARPDPKQAPGWSERRGPSRRTFDGMLAVLLGLASSSARSDAAPTGPASGMAWRYVHSAPEGLKPTVVRTFELVGGPVEPSAGRALQWQQLRAEKRDGTRFTVWWLAREYPSPRRDKAARQVRRYLLREGDGPVVEFRHADTGDAVLPSLAGWDQLLPRNPGDAEVTLLGHRYRRTPGNDVAAGAAFEHPSPSRVIGLRPDLMIGLPSNTRQKDERRRHDGTDYELVPLERADYARMIDAGFTCVRVDARQLPWAEELPTYYWGVGGRDVPFPECLYRSAYLGPAIFLDEPAVGTRDHVLRPRMAKEPAFRKSISPAAAWAAFEEHYDHALREGAPEAFRRSMEARGDVDPGSMSLRADNLYTWETMADTAAHQLARDPRVPAAFVFEPPGRLGTRRTVPEWNMSYGCQLPTDDPGHLASVVYGFLRGAARLTGKEWGTSIYGAVDRADAPFLLTSAYDRGATRFFYWDNYQLACVPFGEALALTRHLRAHAASHPRRDLARLREAAEVAIVVPRGYGLGHVATGKGLLWGLPEMNLERTNAAGATYRAVMASVFLEIEHCRRAGVGFDLVVDLPGLALRGYREVRRVAEDASVTIREAGGDAPRPVSDRTPSRPAGNPPGLDVTLDAPAGPARRLVNARAVVHEGSAPVFFTPGGDPGGVHRNFLVSWELYGPEPEDFRSLVGTGDEPRIRWRDDRTAEVERTFRVEQPGTYRLRASVCDQAGRTTVVWTSLTASLP